MFTKHKMTSALDLQLLIEAEIRQRKLNYLYGFPVDCHVDEALNWDREQQQTNNKKSVS